MTKIFLPFFWLGLALVMGVITFHVSQDVQHAERALRHLNQDIMAHEHSERVLRAEWYYLTEPQRLKDMATTFLPDLQPMTGAQMALLSDVGAKVVALRPPPPVEDVPAEVAGEAAGEAAGALAEGASKTATEALEEMGTEEIGAEKISSEKMGARELKVAPAPSVPPAPLAQEQRAETPPAPAVPAVLDQQKDFSDVLKALEQKAAP